jgi:RNA polymerase sigma-70 factor (ECF subfamily)
LERRSEEEGLYERGRARWPAVALVRATLEAHLRRLGPKRGDHPDLYLAAGCSAGIPAALVAFDRECLSGVPDFVRRIDASADFADEVSQVLRERLLVARQGLQPRIAAYTGRGALGGWVRVAAVRAALDLKAQREQETPDGGIAGAELTGALTPEAAVLKSRYYGTYQRLLREAIAALGSRERELLRLHFVEGMSAEQIGKRHGAHRATAARWLANIRSDVLSRVHVELKKALKISQTDLAGVTELGRSQLGVSMSALLGPRSVDKRGGEPGSP